ncbi:mucin-1-like, partial [Clarias magur]
MKHLSETIQKHDDTRMEVSRMRYTWAALCIVVFMMPGSVKSEEATNSTSAFELIMDITNRIYNDSLLKPGSTDYDALSKNINDMLYSIYGCTTCMTHSFYHNVSAVTFSNETGSVLVKATLLFQSNKTSARVIKDIFMNATADSNETTGLKINRNFTQGMCLGKPVENNESPEPFVTYDLSMDITNQIFNDSLLESGSPDYEILFSKVNGALSSIYGCSTCDTHTFYHGVSAMTFSNKSGTVLVKATLKFHTNQIDSAIIIHLFKKAIEANDEINNLKINPKFTQGMTLEKSGGNNLTTISSSFMYAFTMDITNQIYNNSLLNQDSSDYKLLFTRVNGIFYSIYGCSTCTTRTFYQGVSAMTF